MKQLFTFVVLLLALGQVALNAQQIIYTGADQTDRYFSLLKDKKVGLVANPSSLIGSIHLVDTLLSEGINLIKVFSPEHGFRGKAEAGEKVDSKVDQKTGLPIVSIYGSNKKPKAEDLLGLDLVVFDIQDVGVRFYTYVGTMHYVMEACAESGIPVLILDRPNPNGTYVDGNILDMTHQSFVGMHPVPIVHGMTVGEYAQMINGEGWLEDGIRCDLTIIPCANYTHDSTYVLPVKPSPNLPNQNSIYLYPSLCLFEGTIVSIGRGTVIPFQCYGHPDLNLGSFMFTPESTPGASLHPKHENVSCNGASLANGVGEHLRKDGQISLKYLIGTYEALKGRDDFFIEFFDTLAGGDKLRKQIESGMNEQEIKASWKPGLEKFKKMRAEYLLYPDFH